MIHARAAKIAGIAKDMAPVEADDRAAKPGCCSWAGARRTPRSPPV